MAIPADRYKLLPLRGTKANLDAGITNIRDGEICYAIDQDQYYQNESGTLVSVGATKAQGVLAQSAVQPGDLATVATTGSYNDLSDKPSDTGNSPVDSVNGQTGAVVLDAADVGAATTAQGALADSSIQAGDNISELVNDAGFITVEEVPPGGVTSVNTKTGDVVLDSDDVNEGSSNLYSQWSNESSGIAFQGNVEINELEVTGTVKAATFDVDSLLELPGVMDSGDVLLVNRGSLSYRTTYGNLRDSILAVEPPVITSVSLSLVPSENAARFTNQSFLVASDIVDSNPRATKTIDAHVDGMLSKTVKFTEPLESSNNNSTLEDWASFVTSSQPLASPAANSFDGNPLTSCYSESAADSISWESITFPLSGVFGITNNGYGYTVTIIHGTDTLVESVPDFIGGGPYVWTAPPLGNIQKVTLLSNTATSATNFSSFSLDGVEIIAGQAIEDLALTFAANADMEGIAAGDAVSQVSSFTEPLESLEMSPGGWNLTSAVENQPWCDVTYGDGKFVAISYGGGAMYSTDGINWTLASTPEASPWQRVTYGNGKFVAVANSGTNRVMYSANGITWASTLAAEPNSWTDVTYGDGKFVAVSSSGTNRVMWSTDGVNWTSVLAAESYNWRSVTYGELPDGTKRFVAVSNNGTKRVMYSTNGTQWTLASAVEANNWISVTYGGGKFVAVAGSGTNRVMWSTDGIDWTPASATAANGWYGVTYGGGKFVAVSFDGTNQVMHSTDGINWTSASATGTNYWYGIAYGGGKFVATAVNKADPAMWSINGEDEELKALTFADGTDMTALASSDVVSQVNNFTEPLESSEAVTYSNYLTADEWWSEDFLPENAFQPGSFDGNVGLRAQAADSVDMIFDCSTFPISGEIAWTGYYATQTFSVQREGQWLAQELKTGVQNASTNYTFTFNTQELFGNDDLITGIKSVGGSAGSYATCRGIKINGVILLDNSLSLTFPAATDMTVLAAGDGLSQGATSGTVGFITGTTAALSSSAGPWISGVDVTTGDITTTGTVGPVIGTTATLSSSSGVWISGEDVTTGDKTTTGTVGDVSGTTATLSSSSGTWISGEDIVGPEKTITVYNARLYCVFDSNGDISDLQETPQLPSYTTEVFNPNLVLTFPATFPTGNTPDQDLPEGVTLTVEVTATNIAGTDGPVAATIEP